MGLSSKQVISSDGQDWSQTLLQAQTLELPKPPNNLARRQQNQQNQQQLEPLKCPRCDSINTKFCYYNNYSKSQPRHFCKACKRHWTKGGTLRNVPLGGGRKNKRLKTSSKATNNNSSSSSTTTPTSNNTRSIIHRVNPQLAIQAQHLGIGGDDQKNTSNILYQALIGQPSSAIQQDSINLDNTNSINGVFLGSSLSLPQSQSLNFPYPLSSSFDTNPCSTNRTSFKSSIPYSYSAGEAMEDSIITTIMPSTSSSMTHTWQVANTSNGMEGWNWDDLENFVSTDLNISWDDPDQIKP